MAIAHKNPQELKVIITIHELRYCNNSQNSIETMKIVL